MYFNMARSIAFIVDRMNVTSGEKVLVYCEAEKAKIGELLVAESLRRGAKAILALGVAHTLHRQEPPEPATAAMKASDVVFCVTQKSMTHTDARGEAIKLGARFGLLIGIDEEYLSTFDVSEEDLALISERTKKLFNIESEANRARVTTSLGTDLQMSISGRTPLRGTPPKVFEKVGERETLLLPDYSEVSISPVEGTAEGKIVCDGWVMNIDSLLEEPITFNIKKGNWSLEGGWQAKELENYFAQVDKNAKLVCELGIGLHHKAPKTWKVNIQDKKILGVTHIGFGKNDDIGGRGLVTPILIASSRERSSNSMGKWPSRRVWSRPLGERSNGKERSFGKRTGKVQENQSKRV